MLRMLTAGESHGTALTAIVEGFPAGVPLDKAFIDRELERRQGGYGRGKRQKLETDRVFIDSGTFKGISTGAPITLRLINNDAKLERLAEPAAPRGGHVDLAGSISYQTGIRQVLERASARETAVRVAAGPARARRHGPSLRFPAWARNRPATTTSPPAAHRRGDAVDPAPARFATASGRVR